MDMRTAQVAHLAGVGAQTLRYYERRGLLPEPVRSGAGYRSYGPEAVRIVRFVKRAQELGFRLADVEELLQLAGGGPESCESARTLASEKISELDTKIAHLVAIRDSLRHLVATCERSPVNRECPLLHALDEPSNAISAGRDDIE